MPLHRFASPACPAIFAIPFCLRRSSTSSTARPAINESGSDRLNTQFPILDKHATRYPPLFKIRIRWRGDEAFAGLYGNANLVAFDGSVTRPCVRIRPVDCCHDFFLRPSRRRANECQARKCVNQVSIHHCGRSAPPLTSFPIMAVSRSTPQ